MVMTLALLAACQSVELRGRLLDEGGSAVAGATVVLEMGRQRWELNPGKHAFVVPHRRTARTDAEGNFSFDEIPGDARVHLVSTGGLQEPEAPIPHDEPASRFAVVKGIARQLARTRQDLRLHATLTLEGEISSRGARVYVVTGDGWTSGLAERQGRFEMRGMAPGEGYVMVLSNNFAVETTLFELNEAGPTALGAFRLPSQPSVRDPDPDVDCRRVRLVDAEERPLPGLEFVWSTRWMDGWTKTDERGEVQLTGGGVEIGSPPYRLRLGWISNEETGQKYFATVAQAGETAILRVVPMAATTVSVRRSRSDEPVTDVAAYALLEDTDPVRPFRLELRDGRLGSPLPPGRYRLLVGTIQGERIERSFEVPQAESHEVTVEIP